jgi:hypothetical protein
MRKFLMLTTLIATVFVVLAADRARGDETKGTKAAQAAKDPNYRWFNGQWWYWMAKDKNWRVWNGSQWTKYDQAQANRGGVRSFSYQANGDQGVQRMFGTPLTSVPGTVANTQIIGSYGFHSAGSKAMGNY